MTETESEKFRTECRNEGRPMGETASPWLMTRKSPGSRECVRKKRKKTKFTENPDEHLSLR